MNWLKRLGKRELEFAKINVDLHSHLIPGIDDGSKDLQDSFAMIRGLMDLGYTKAITTPHIKPGRYDNNPTIINEGLFKLREALKTENIRFEVEAAAEYYLGDELYEEAGSPGLLTFGDNYLLFELSFYNRPAFLEDAIFRMQAAGYKPILAHPERYGFLLDDRLSEYRKLKDKGVFFQMNIGSAVGMYSSEVTRISKGLLDAGMIDFLGSDLHNKHQLGYLRSGLSAKILHKYLKTNSVLNASI